MNVAQLANQMRARRTGRRRCSSSTTSSGHRTSRGGGEGTPEPRRSARRLSAATAVHRRADLPDADILRSERHRILDRLPGRAARASTWDLDLENQVGQDIGDELLASGNTMVFAPVVNISATRPGAVRGDVRRRLLPPWTHGIGVRRGCAAVCGRAWSTTPRTTSSVAASIATR